MIIIIIYFAWIVGFEFKSLYREINFGISNGYTEFIEK